MAAVRQAPALPLQDANKKAPVTPGRRKSGGPADNGKGGRRATTFGLRRQSMMPPAASSMFANTANRRQSAMPMPSAPKTPSRASNASNAAVSKQANRRSTGRQSMAQRGQRQLQDPRDIKGKQFINESIQRLVDYLAANDYPHKQLSVDDLRRPSTKDFWQIFEFMFCQIDPTWKLPEKDPQEEVPNLLKALGYPFAISKSAMLSAGAPHTWPMLLAALSWLRELLEYDEAAHAKKEEDNADSAYQLFLQYVTRGYQCFLQSSDPNELDAIEDEARLEFTQRAQTLKQDLERKQKEKAQLEAELDRLKNDPKRPRFLKQDRAVFQSDVAKFEKLVVDLQKHEQSLDEKFTQMQQRKVALQDDLSSLTQACVQYEQQVKTQAASNIDAEKIQLSRTSLTASLTEARAKKSQINERVWGLEMSVAEQWAQCEKSVEQYNTFCRQLQLSPMSAPNAMGVDYSLNVHAKSDGLPQLSKDIKKEVKQHLQAFVSQLRARELEIWSQTLDLQNQLDALKDEVKDLAYKVEEVDAEFNRLDHVRVERKSRLEDELRRKLDQLEAMKGEMQARLMAINQRQAESDAELDRRMRMHEDVETDLRQRHQDFYNKTIATMDLLTNYKTYVQKTLADFKTSLVQVLETTV